MQTTREYEKCYILCTRAPLSLFFGVLIKDPISCMKIVFGADGPNCKDIINGIAFSMSSYLCPGHCNFSNYYYYVEREKEDQERREVGEVPKCEFRFRIFSFQSLNVPIIL